MAVTSSPASKAKVVTVHPEKDKRSRTKSPGVRLIGARIYDSENGKTCHQCRQKTRDFTAPCKNMKGNKQCTIGFCHKCLLNRYGEKAEEVALLDDWKCPKCRGICNCSICMKKSGNKPTGILVHLAKEGGFSSVSELLQVKGRENFSYEKVSLKKHASLKEKLGKENSFDGKNNLNCPDQNLSPLTSEKKSRKTKRDGLKEVSNDKRDKGVSLGKNRQKKPRISEEVCNNEVKRMGKDEVVQKRKSKVVCNNEVKTIGKDAVKEKKKSKESKKRKKEAENNEVVVEGETESKTHLQDVLKNGSNVNREDEGCHGNPGAAKCNVGEIKNCEKYGNLRADFETAAELCNITKCNGKIREKSIDVDIQLPLGTCLTTLAGIELPPEVVGHALQFLEFCSAFGKVLKLKKGHAEAVITDMINGRRGRRSQYSVTAQFHMDLLSLIEEDTGERSPSPSPKNDRNSWLRAFGKYVSECELLSKEFPSACFDGGHEGYDKLHISEKLKLLNFLCDEVLNTKDLRDWIDNEQTKFKEKKKEAREKVLAAKDKEKQLKQQIQDEMAKAIIAKNGASLSIAEHDAIVSKIKSKTNEVHSEMLEAMGMVPKKGQIPDAVRTEPILLVGNGCAFWRLKVYNGQRDILLQDVVTWDSNALSEKWFVYDAEQKEEIEKCISSLRTKRIRAQKAAETIMTGNDEMNSSMAS